MYESYYPEARALRLPAGLVAADPVSAARQRLAHYPVLRLSLRSGLA